MTALARRRRLVVSPSSSASPPRRTATDGMFDDLFALALGFEVVWLRIRPSRTFLD